MPRKRRWRKRSRSAPSATFNKANCTSKCKQWTEQQMLAAITMAENGDVSANQAADVHGVPCLTLNHRLKGTKAACKLCPDCVAITVSESGWVAVNLVPVPFTRLQSQCMHAASHSFLCRSLDCWNHYARCPWRGQSV